MSESPTPPDEKRRLHQISIGVLALVLVLLGGFTLWRFLSALVWAAIFAIALWPFYRRTLTRFGRGRHNILWPALFTAGVALVFILPVALVSLQIVHEAHFATGWLHGIEQNGLPEPALLHHLPFGQAQVDDWWQKNLADPGSARELVQRTTKGRVGDMGRVVAVQVIRRLTLFVFTLVTLFFLFREGDEVTRQLRRAAVRAFGPGGERVGMQIIASVHGTVDGLVLVGLGFGLVMGLVYAVAGVPHPTVFGALTAISGMIPLAGYTVFTTAALVLLATGSIGWAIAVFAIGAVVIFIADHFIRPVLIGGATKLPFLWVLLGVLGGIEAWGLLGVFLGPAIMAALILLWREWTEKPLR